jgi:hypothetical protein
VGAVVAQSTRRPPHPKGFCWAPQRLQDQCPEQYEPIFRDREDFSGGGALAAATIATLDASTALLVLCSSHSAVNLAVNEEIRLFRSRHPDLPVTGCSPGFIGVQAYAGTRIRT